MEKEPLPKPRFGKARLVDAAAAALLVVGALAVAVGEASMKLFRRVRMATIAAASLLVVDFLFRVLRTWLRNVFWMAVVIAVVSAIAYALWGLIDFAVKYVSWAVALPLIVMLVAALAFAIGEEVSKQ